MTFNLNQSIPYTEGTFFGTNSNFNVEHISMDSRSLQNGAGTLFFAIKGTHTDGHHFIEELIRKGVRYFVVEHIPENLQTKANFLVVKNTVMALQNIVSYYRSLFTFPVIGITGSNGKTIVKEWLNFLLSPEYNICKSPKSYNSQIGVPLSVVAINEFHNFGIFEAGISKPNEMSNLQKVIQPTLGILTNVGSAHNEGFDTFSTKVTEKLLLFQEVETLIYKADKTIESLINKDLTTYTWKFISDKTTHESTENVNIYRHFFGTYTTFSIIYSDKNFEVTVPFTDEASLENCATCITTLLYLGYEEATIQKRLPLLYPIEMRLKVKKGKNNTLLIDDSYSSDFQSFKIALDFLETQKQHTQKTLIVSDIFQSGFSENELYEKVFQYIRNHNIQRVFIIGETISNYKNLTENCFNFTDTQGFLDQLSTFNFGNETILVKGARAFNFEKIMTVLEEQTHETVFEINLNAIIHNLNYFRSKLKPTTQLMAMVKAFGYGNGGIELAKLLEYQKIDYLGVAFADEGIYLKNNGIQVPIMVLNPEISSYESIILHNLEPEMYSFRGLEAFTEILIQKNIKNYPIHLKIDTGMHRLGFMPEWIDELIEKLSNNPYISIKSILSHLAASDDELHIDFTNKQIELFKNIAAKISNQLNIKPLLHILNTSGISNFTDAQFDMVRLGIGLYGISNDEREQQYLENVGTLKSVISQIRTIKTGESVGYNRRFVAKNETKIATIPIGYADGIRRAWGNGVGYVLVNQQQATIVGSVCMDMLMVDVTTINCKEGDSVIIFGAELPVTFMAKKLNTISYELLTGISHRVKRVFYRE